MIPKNAVVELTNVCQLRCEFCPRCHMDKWDLGYIKPEDFRALIDELSGQVKTLITSWRGESTLHKDFVSLSNYAWNKFDKTVLITNGLFSNRIERGIRYYDLACLSWHENPNILDTIQRMKQNGCEVEISLVEGEHDNELDMISNVVSKINIYKKHTINGQWGVTNISRGTLPCERLEKQIVISHDLKMSRCCYYWPTEDIKVGLDPISTWQKWRNDFKDSYPDETCLLCDQKCGETERAIINGHKLTTETERIQT